MRCTSLECGSVGEELGRLPVEDLDACEGRVRLRMSGEVQRMALNERSLVLVPSFSCLREWEGNRSRRPVALERLRPAGRDREIPVCSLNGPEKSVPACALVLVLGCAKYAPCSTALRREWVWHAVESENVRDPSANRHVRPGSLRAVHQIQVDEHVATREILKQMHRRHSVEVMASEHLLLIEVSSARRDEQTDTPSLASCATDGAARLVPNTAPCLSLGDAAWQIGCPADAREVSDGHTVDDPP